MLDNKMFKRGFLFGLIFGFVFGASFALILVGLTERAEASEVREREVMECPSSDYRCIPEDTAQKWLAILEQRQCMDRALDEMNENLQLEFSDYHVTITEDGQVFDQESLEIDLEWCDYEVAFMAKPNLSISMTEEDASEEVWGFRLRIRLGAALWVPAITDENKTLLSPVLMVEPFFIHHFHVAAYGGLDHFGVVLGFDLTKNLNLFGGVGATWDNPPEVGPTLGMSLSFN